jgi:hypothetical protein
MRWAYDDVADAEAANVLEPLDGKKDTGYAAAEQPTAQHENWFKTLAYQWMKFFDRVKTWNVHVDAYVPSTTAPTRQLQGWYSLSSGNSSLKILLPQPDGAEFSAATLKILEADSGGEEITAQIYEQAIAGGSPVAVGPLKTSGTTGAAAELTWTTSDSGIPFSYAGDKSYYILVTLNQTSAASESAVFGLKYSVQEK